MATDGEKLLIDGDTYETPEECMQQGVITANWLTQDMVTVTWRCVEKHEEKR
jgi:hypothetical protein